MKIITFRKEFKELILSGKKTETRRVNKYVKLGDILLAKVGRLGKAFAELEVQDFYREKLQDMTLKNYFNEGWIDCQNKIEPCLFCAIDWFKNIWNSINKKPNTQFEDNPTVSVIRFKLIKIR
jgi:ASC-1-like (ASCH) protein